MQCSQQPSPRDLGREGKRGNRRSVGRSIGLALVCACRMTVVVVRERGRKWQLLSGLPPEVLALKH